MSISSQLSQIAAATQGGGRFQSIDVRKGKGSFSCDIQKSAWHYLPTWMLSLLSRWVPVGFKEGNRETLKYFHKVFGGRVIQEVCSYRKRLDDGIALSSREVKQLFDVFEKREPARCAALFQALGPRKQVTEIGTALQKKWNFQRVVIDGEKGPRFCRTARSIHSIIPKRIASVFSLSGGRTYRSENRKTIKYFYTLFGFRRMDRISKRFGLKLRERFAAGDALTRGDIEKIYAGMAEVRHKDVQELFKIVQGRKTRGLGTFEMTAYDMLVTRFRGKTFADLTKGGYDDLYRYLVPFDEMKTIFLNNVPKFKFKPQLTSGLKKLHQRLFLCETIRRDEHLDERIWDVWVAKGFLKRRKQDIGVIIPHPDGYYKVFGELEAKGASYLMMKALQPELPSIVKAHGTRTGMSWDAIMSMIDDFSDEVGTRGVNATEASLRYLLGKRVEGKRVEILEEFDRQYSGITKEPFYRSLDERFKGMAFSLGCANLQLLTERDPKLFSRLALSCPPGISAERCDAYAKRAIDDGPSIRYMIEVDDIVHRGGGGDLGVGCLPAHTQIELVAYAPKEMSREEVTALLLFPPDLPEKALYLALAIVKAFTGAHVRNTTLREEYTSAVFDNRQEGDRKVIDTVLGDDAVEAMRRKAAAKGRKGAQRVKRGVAAAKRRAIAVKRRALERKKSASARIRALRALGTRLLSARG